MKGFLQRGFLETGATGMLGGGACEMGLGFGLEDPGVGFRVLGSRALAVDGL